MTEIFIENLITNGDVEKDANGWEVITGDLTRISFTGGNHALKLAATEDNQSIDFKCTEKIPLIRSHKYYMSFNVAQYGDASKVVQVYWPDDSALPAGSATTPQTGKWYRATSILSVSYNSSGMYQVRFVVENAPSTQYAYFDQMMLVDLTEAFGAGNEPTVDWCNENIEYFDGKKSLSMWFTTALIIDAEVIPTEVPVDGSIKIVAKVQSEKKIYEVESLYAGEIYAGEV